MDALSCMLHSNSRIQIQCMNYSLIQHSTNCITQTMKAEYPPIMLYSTKSVRRLWINYCHSIRVVVDQYVIRIYYPNSTITLSHLLLVYYYKLCPEPGEHRRNKYQVMRNNTQHQLKESAKPSSMQTQTVPNHMLNNQSENQIHKFSRQPFVINQKQQDPSIQIVVSNAPTRNSSEQQIYKILNYSPPSSTQNSFHIPLNVGDLRRRSVQHTSYLPAMIKNS